MVWRPTHHKPAGASPLCGCRACRQWRQDVGRPRQHGDVGCAGFILFFTADSTGVVDQGVCGERELWLFYERRKYASKVPAEPCKWWPVW